MKKATVLLALFCVPFLGQGQIKFGVQGGFSYSRTQLNNSYKNLELSHLLGPMAGIMFGMNIDDKHFSIMQEFNYVHKGARMSATDISTNTSIPVKGKHVAQFLEMPLNLLYYLNAGNGHFFVGGGPYAAIGINGKNSVRYEMVNAPEVEDTKVGFGKNIDELKKWDFGVHGLIGYKLGYGSYVKAFYSHGISNLSNAGGINYYNRYFGISFGYFFNSGR
jgi:hypothetical protein